MDEQGFKDYLGSRYEDQIKYYDGKAIRNQRFYEFFQWSVIILSALTPILILISNSWERYIAVGVSALVAIGTTLLKTFKYQENWINYRTTCETLKKEIHYFEAQVDEYKNCEDPRSLFVERVESLISRENTLWLNIHKQKKEESPKK